MLISILTLLTGIGVFIAGMNMMSSGLEKSAGKGMKRLLGSISTNRFAGVATGIAYDEFLRLKCHQRRYLA